MLFLGIFALAALAATTFLLNAGKPAEAVAVVSGAMGVALGGLGTLLASTRTGEPSPSVTEAVPLPPVRVAGSGPIGDAAP